MVVSNVQGTIIPDVTSPVIRSYTLDLSRAINFSDTRSINLSGLAIVSDRTTIPPLESYELTDWAPTEALWRSI